MDVVADVVEMGRGHPNKSGQQEENFQGWKILMRFFTTLFFYRNSILSMPFIHNMPQSSMFSTIDMNLFHNQRPPATQPLGAFMVNYQYLFPCNTIDSS